MTKSAKLPTTLPPSLYKYFWDTKAANVDVKRYPYYVINRLLDKGDLEAARWVLRNFPREMIVETLWNIREFSPWNGRFWAHYFKIPEEEVACLRKSYLTMRRMHWPF